MIFRHAWLIFVVVTCLNGASWWYKGRREMAENPDLKPGYRRLVWWWLICGNMPWLVMGAGILSGSVPSPWHYFSPRNGPFVIAFYITVVALWIAAFHWLFFRGGAEDLVTHPGLLNLRTQSPRAVKGLFLVALAGGVAGLLMMILGAFPVVSLPEMIQKH
jgi:hypothetical protein